MAAQVQDWLRVEPTLPLPGRGATCDRWATLARIAASDVCMAKVLEAHHDAVAINAELGYHAADAGQLWAVWAAEPPGLALLLDRCRGTLTGTKGWCSGADLATDALVTCTDGQNRQLVHVRLDAPGLGPVAARWDAVGMARVVSGSLTFDQVPATPVGEPGQYLSRPGFWHGGAGIAACWFGATSAIAETLRVHGNATRDPHAAAHLGMIDVQLSALRALLRETAVVIDAQPGRAHRHAVMRVRSLAERVATETIDRVGRALGAGPLCQDAAHAQRCADLATFIRQSHAERDWASLGEAAAQGHGWAL